MLKSSQVALPRVNRPSRSFVRRCCMAAAAASLLYSAMASALGLGEITLHSALEQPFNADIELIETAGLTADDIHVSLASQDAFNRAGVERLFFLNDLRFTTVINGNRGVVHVVSKKPVSEPYLSFLVRLARPNGDLVHAYTVLIDPPESAQGRAASRARWVEPKDNNHADARMPVAPPQAVQGNHYTVVSGDNLGAIARRLLGPGSQTSAADIAQGIKALNPQAFPNGSGTRLKVGQNLLLPDSAVLPRSVAVPVTPSAKPAVADSTAPAAVVSDEQKTAERLAADAIENQQLTKSVGDLKGQIQGLQDQVSGKDKQVIELQTALAELRAKPVAPTAAVPAVMIAPIVAAPIADSFISIPLLIGAVLVLLLLLGVAYSVRRKRLKSVPPEQAVQVTPDPTTPSPMRARVVESPRVEAVVAPVVPAVVAASSSSQRLAGAATDALDGASIYIAYGRFTEALGILREASLKQPQRTDLRLRILELLAEQGDVDGFAREEQALLDHGISADAVQEVRARYPQMFIKPEPVAVPLPQVPAEVVLKPGLAPVQSDSRFVEPETPIPVAQPVDEFHLNLDDLSMDAGWDLVDPFEPPPAPRNKIAPQAEPEFASNLTELPEVFEIPDELFLSDFAEPEPEPEPELEPNIQSNNDALDDGFLDGFMNDSTEFDVLDLADDEPLSKINHAQLLIDEGELDEARALLQEVIKEGDVEHQRKAQDLLAGIS
ncbi:MULTISPECIES: FimV/HubP family polar landmark protein [unclassified Pseudomonas]|uniref:FimV/HubP family polar landmark protein n=2 Tax=unclassified Pseudomonas TaxID=196821 RepID=UPI002AC8F0B8|nr:MULTISPECIES: FimV/HubP family polar landmark protein [unclassified Pseudomonas]WPX53714.1 FimV/HubP family polar landmark protein [Pseudomonas sp. CCI4.2]